MASMGFRKLALESTREISSPMSSVNLLVSAAVHRVRKSTEALIM